MAYVIGIDVGSQSVKAVLFDQDGTAVERGRRALRDELPAQWLGRPGSGLLGARDRAGGPRAAAAHRASGRARSRCSRSPRQVDGLVALDDDLRPLRPAIIWLDRRATRQSDRLSEAVGEDELIARTGLNPDASHTAPKAMWLRDEEPEHYRAARWLAPVGGHLTGWLTGEVVQDPANASCTLLYDLRSRRLGPRTGRAGRPRRREAAADPPRGRGDRTAPGRTRRRRSASPPAVASPWARATSTARRSAPAPSRPE